MANIFNTQDNEELISRIEKLTPESQPLWGKMRIDQMLKHCAAPMDVAFGTLPLKIAFPMRILGRLLKNRVLNNEFKQGSPTAPQFLFPNSYEFEIAKQELIEKTKKFQNGIQLLQLEVHPFWGKLTTAEWNNLQWKHLDHHLRQFGV